MATLSAFRNLGASILSDIVDAKDTVARAYRAQKTERQVMKDFRNLVRENPAFVAKVFTEAAQAEQPKTRRTKKTTTK